MWNLLNGAFDLPYVHVTAVNFQFEHLLCSNYLWYNYLLYVPWGVLRNILIFAFVCFIKNVMELVSRATGESCPWCWTHPARRCREQNHGQRPDVYLRRHGGSDEVFVTSSTATQGLKTRRRSEMLNHFSGVKKGSSVLMGGNRHFNWHH